MKLSLFFFSATITYTTSTTPFSHNTHRAHFVRNQMLSHKNIVQFRWDLPREKEICCGWICTQNCMHTFRSQFQLLSWNLRIWRFLFLFFLVVWETFQLPENAYSVITSFPFVCSFQIIIRQISCLATNENPNRERKKKHFAGKLNYVALRKSI